MPRYIPRIVNFEEHDLLLVWRAAKEKGLGGKGFSAAVRLIIREWEAFRNGLLLAYPTKDPPQKE